MTRNEMDQLKVGDPVEVRTYNTTEEEYEWAPTEVSRVLVCTDGGKFLHGGYHSVEAKVNGFTEILSPELTRRAEEKPETLPNSCAECQLGRPYGFVGDVYCTVLNAYFTGNIKPPHKERPDDCPLCKAKGV